MDALVRAAGAAFAALLLTVGIARAAETWPTRAIRLVVPFPPGGGTDVAARTVAAHLGDALGQQVWIDNRPGAGGTLGSELVAQAAPDGYTVGIATSSTHPASVVVQKGVPYDPVASFAPITMIGTTPYVLIASPRLPPATLGEFIAYAKANPGKLNYASVGATTLGYIVTRQFMLLSGTNDMVHVPYKGSSQIYPDLMSNEVSIEFDNPSGSAALINAGKLKAYAITQPSSVVPAVPSFAKLGVAGLDTVFWYGLVAPRATPSEIVKRIRDQVACWVQSAEGRADLLAKGIEAVGDEPAQFGATIAHDIATFRTVAEKLGIQPE